jgi:hypothetical protein
VQHVHPVSTVAFQSLASDFLCTDRCHTCQRVINLVSDVFVHDRRTRHTIRASADRGEQWMEGSRAPWLDETVRVIVFASRHPLNHRDEAHDEDLYVWLARPYVDESSAPFVASDMNRLFAIVHGELVELDEVVLERASNLSLWALSVPSGAGRDEAIAHQTSSPRRPWTTT